MRWRGGATPFERAVLPHLDAATNLARWLTRDPRLADDVVQDAMLRALTYFSSFRGGDARLWLLRIVRNATYDTLRARRPAEVLDAAEDIADPADTPEMAVARIEGQAQVEQALAALPVALRECLVLRELEELSYKEIAAIAGVPIGTVMSRLWRARRVLAASLGVEAADER